jgi:methylglutaconyl-CoA hydratase
MGFRYLDIRREDGVEYVTLNRPDVRNAFNEGTITELTWWADSVAADAAVRAVVLAGNGPAFCAGADLEWMRRMATFSHQENLDDASDMARLFLTLDRLPMPVIGRVHGAALGGGVGLAAICDIVVAGSSAQFGLTEVRLGLVPAVIAPFVIAKIGRSAARELFLTGARFSAERARTLGLVHAVVADDEVDAAIRGYLADLLAGAPGAVRAAKHLIAECCKRPHSDAATLCAEAIAERRASPEGQEGIKAFLEKRKPNWG